MATIMFHIFASVAISCVIWIGSIIPMTSPNNTLSLTSTTFWGVCIPSLMLANKSIYGNETGEDNFVIVKFLSIVVSVLAFQTFRYIYSFGNEIYPLPMTITMNSLLCINIAEACISQILNYSISRDWLENLIDISNGIVGIGVICSVIYNAIYGNLMTITQTSEFIDVKTQITTWTIVSYTFWNLLFRVQIKKTPSVLPFFICSLILPLCIHYIYDRDWVHVRAICLMMWMIIALGFGKDEMRMLPMYTKDTLSNSYSTELSNSMREIKSIEMKNSVIVKIQENVFVRFILVIGGAATCILSFFVN